MPENVLASGVVAPSLLGDDLCPRQQLSVVVVREELVILWTSCGPPANTKVSWWRGLRRRWRSVASRANAAITGRDFVTPDDIKSMAVPVLEHRLILRPEFEIEGLGVVEVIQKILQEIAVPR